MELINLYTKLIHMSREIGEQSAGDVSRALAESDGQSLQFVVMP
jgi:hypothetical protein